MATLPEMKETLFKLSSTAAVWFVLHGRTKWVGKSDPICTIWSHKIY